ncbi:MAG: RNA-binding protein [Gammaproteobacteria bacterium]
MPGVVSIDDALGAQPSDNPGLKQPMTPAQRRQLRARAHGLKPVILVGDAGVSDAVLAETDRALHDHELIKVRLPAADRDSRAQMAERLCERLGAEHVQAIGHMRVIFRANPPETTESSQTGAAARKKKKAKAKAKAKTKRSPSARR